MFDVNAMHSAIETVSNGIRNNKPLFIICDSTYIYNDTTIDLTGVIGEILDIWVDGIDIKIQWKPYPKSKMFEQFKHISNYNGLYFDIAISSRQFYDRSPLINDCGIVAVLPYLKRTTDAYNNIYQYFKIYNNLGWSIK
jgi:hypothetical protein